MEDMDIVSVMLIEGVCVNAGDSTIPKLHVMGRTKTESANEFHLDLDTLRRGEKRKDSLLDSRL